MSIAAALRRYVRGVLLFPYYATRTYELANTLASRLKNAQAGHDAIYDSCDAKGAARANGKIAISGLTVNLEPKRVIETVNEVFIRQDYDFGVASRNYIMIDIGMNVGLAALRHASLQACCHVYGFEPLTPTFDRAQRNFELNPDIANKISCFNYGLSDVDARLIVKYSNNDIMSASSEATFDSCFDGPVTEESIEVRCASTVLKDILEKHSDSSVFLKIDCEGAEFRILPSLADSGLLRCVSVIILEWHAQDPQALLDILHQHGFFYFLHKIDEQWNVGLIKAVNLSCA